MVPKLNPNELYWKAKRESEVIARWRARPTGQRSSHHVLAFYGELQSEGYDFLALFGRQPPYESLKSLLAKELEP
jgi:hypothetical protein